MTCTLRPPMPPLALMSSAASWSALVIDAPATAPTSQMTPILIGGSAARAGGTHVMAASPHAAIRGGSARCARINTVSSLIRTSFPLHYFQKDNVHQLFYHQFRWQTNPSSCIAGLREAFGGVRT